VIDFQEKPGEVRHFVHKRLLGATKGFFGGGILGATRGFLASPRKASRRRSVGRIGPPGQSFTSATRARPRRSSRAAPSRRRSKAARLAARPELRPGFQAATAGCPQGFHPNKSDYMTKGGFVAAGSKCVRNRRRNLSNGRANTRSLRRMAAWDKQERKLGKTLKAIARGR